MPEKRESTSQISIEEESDQEQKIEKEYNEKMDKQEEFFGDLFNDNKDPIRFMLEEINEEGEQAKIFGVERFKKLKEDLQKLEYTGKNDFVNQVTVLMEPFIKDRFFNKEMREQLEALEKEDEWEEAEVGKLTINIRPIKQEFTFSSDIKVSAKDKVVEISWPEEEGQDKPQGARDLTKSFKEIANFIKERPEIKAVVGVSWMMSRSITNELGFEKFPEIDIDSKKRNDIMDLANTARKDKGYIKKRGEAIKKEEVIFGAISRDEFLKKYG